MFSPHYNLAHYLATDSFSMLLECDDDGYTALHHAARYNRDAVLSLFLDIDAGNFFIKS